MPGRVYERCYGDKSTLGVEKHILVGKPEMKDDLTLTMQRPSSGAPDTVYQKQTDKSLYATFSLYISGEKMDGLFKNWNKKKRLEIRDSFEQTAELRQAIDPLFNDIAIRDRNSTVEEFLIDVKGQREVERIIITLPQLINWETEGTKFRVDLGDPVSRELKCRMFWYAHSDGALSYHISFFMEYKHEFIDYYFLSMLQKLMFPKEFYVPKGMQGSAKFPRDITAGNTGLWLLDETLVSNHVDYADLRKGVERLTFWRYVQKRFVSHMDELVNDTGIEFRDRSKAVAAENSRLFWDDLIEKTEFIEVPYLEVPPARALFIFQDKEFFDLLQETKRSTTRGNLSYQVHMPPGWEDQEVVHITAQDFYRPSSASGEFDIRYYFLSGFFQNIIDFLNQDASEIRDGTDPIYPITEAQQKEALFMRFANGRSIYQVVERSRSLDVGNDFIGTCPYIFLVHLMTLHNEFLIRKFELETADVQDKLSNPALTEYGDLQQLLGRSASEPTKTSELKKATQPFYEFRYKAFAIYKRHLYINTFRYDTERDVFEQLQQIRGTESRLQRCDDIVIGLDKTIQDIEEDKRYQEQQQQAESNLKRIESDRILNLAVFGVGIFSALQVFYAIVEKFPVFVHVKGGFPNISFNFSDWTTLECEYALLNLLTLVLVIACSLVILRALAARRAASRE